MIVLCVIALYLIYVLHTCREQYSQILYERIFEPVTALNHTSTQKDTYFEQ